MFYERHTRHMHSDETICLRSDLTGTSYLHFDLHVHDSAHALAYDPVCDWLNQGDLFSARHLAFFLPIAMSLLHLLIRKETNKRLHTCT